ncbi:hypothetical protein G9A89_003093 [Geosiphon pyriformis]|nr:hypothetical protein G9A89_003093 [Geosiphon pyriformis]
MSQKFFERSFFNIQYNKTKPFFDFEATVSPSITIMRKITKESSFGGGLKSALLRKKRKSVALKEGALDNHSWGFETGNTTESKSIDMEEECLVEKTSFDYGKSGTVANKNYDQTPKEPDIKTKKALGKPLRKIDFSGCNDNNDNVFLDVFLELSLLLKNLVTVAVRKFFALDINLDKVLMVIRKLFSKVNGFGKTSTFSKFSEVIYVSFTSKSSLAQTTEKTRVVNILVNTNLKKSTGHSDWTVIKKKIPVRTLAETVCAVLSEFGSVVSIKIQLVGLWQKAVTDLVADRWFILIKKDAVRVAKASHKTLLYTLPMGTNAYDIWDFVGSVGGKTCVINRHLVIYVQVRCAVVCFNSIALINVVMETIPVLKGANLCWSYLSSVKYNKCGNLDHILLSCSVGENVFSGSPTYRLLSDDNKSRLASIYARCSALISHPVSFGGVSWANIVGRFLFSPLPVCNGSTASGSSSEIKPIPVVSMELNDRFATLKHSFASLAECVDKLAMRLNLFRPTVSQLNPGCQSLVTSSLQNQGVDIVMSKSSGVATGSKAIAKVTVFNPLVISKMKKTLNNFSIMVMGFSAKINNADLVPAIINKFDGVRIFSFGLDKEFLGAGVTIIMNNSFAHYMSKVEEIPGYFYLVWLLFKPKLSVVFLGLYAGASARTRFGQACKINSFIAKAINFSTFVVLGSDFNEDEYKKSTSFKFCSDLGLDAVKVINYIFISKSLLSVLAGYEVTSVSDFFDTNHNAVLLNGEHKQANKDKWKFKIKDADANNAKITKNLDTMWKILKEVVTSLANSVFFRHWFSEFNCLKNKQSSKFFKLELLVAKLIKCLSLDQESKTVCLFKSKYYEFRVVRNISIKKAIDKHIKFFSSNKEHMIKSVLDQPFRKVVLDHLIVDNELILEPKKVKLASNQYAPLDYVSDRAFSNVMDVIGLDEFLLVVKELSDGKAAGISVLKSTSTQTPIFTIGSIIKNVLEKNKKLWLTNQVMTDFGLTDRYTVHNGLDQEEVFLLLLTSRVNPKGSKTSFFVASAFVDNTIWVENCLAAAQHILDIARAREVLLSISGSRISIAKKNESYQYLGIFFSMDGLSKPSLAKAHSNVKFFSNMVLRKTITKKQFLYLVSAVLQFIKDTTARINPAAKLRKKLGIIATSEKLLPLPLNLCPLYKELHNKTFRSTKTFRYHTFSTLSTKVAFEHQRTSTDNTKPKVAESEIIGANHLEFTKSLFQHYCQYLRLNHNHISTESAFNFYINEKISSLLGTLPLAWKKNRAESPSNLSYHYTPESAINISSTNMFPSTDHMANTLRDLIHFGISDLWEAVESEKEEEKSEDQEFTYQHPITENLEVETPNIQTQQQLENPEIETPNIRTPPNQRNQKPELIN